MRIKLAGVLTMVFLLTETIYTNEKGDLLLKAIQTRIMR